MKWNIIHTRRFEETPSGYPILKPLEDDFVFPKGFIPFHRRSKKDDKENLGIHFFEDDKDFECIYTKPDRYINLFAEYNCLITPDFSCYIDFPMQIRRYNHFRRQWMGAYWQSFGFNVIPDLQWGDETSYEYCFEGIPKNSIIAVSSSGCFKNLENRYIFYTGWDKMFEVLNPFKVLLYGVFPEDLSHRDKVVYYEHFLKKMCKERTQREQLLRAQKKMPLLWDNGENKNEILKIFL